MAKCELCGGTAFTKEGEFYICHGCGSRFKKEDLIMDTPVQTESGQESEPAETKSSEDSGGCAGVFMTFLGVMLLVVLSILIATGGLEGCDIPISISEVKDSIGVATKTKPSVSASESLSGLVFSVNANDDYELVEIEVTVYDKDGAVIDIETLQGYNYKKGGVYKLTYEYPLEMLLRINRYTFRVLRYR